MGRTGESRLVSARLLVIAAMLLLSDAVLAQAVPPQPFNKQSQWLAWNGDHSVAGRWGIHFDAGFRMMNDSAWQQWLVRPGVNYQLNRNIQIGVAYAMFRTAPAGFSEKTGAFPEHRIHQQISVWQRAGKLALRHRVRTEQRFLGSGFRSSAERTWSLQNRTRYLIRTDVPLLRTSGERVKVYAAFYNESLFRFGGLSQSGLDQNRVYSGIGLRTTEKTALEAGVINQRFRPAAGGRLENNWIFLATWVVQMPVRQLFQGGASPAPESQRAKSRR